MTKEKTIGLWDKNVGKEFCHNCGHYDKNRHGVLCDGCNVNIDSPSLYVPRKAYNRDYLVEQCEKGLVEQKNWKNKNTPAIQIQLGECRTFLSVGCKYDIDGKKSNDKIISVIIDLPGEEGKKTYIVPTDKLIKENGGDWL